MLVSLDGCDVYDIMLHGDLLTNQRLPKLAEYWIGNLATTCGYDPLETFDGVLMFLALQKFQAKNHFTPLEPAALEATVSYLLTGRDLGRENQLTARFCQVNPIFSRFICNEFSIATLFGSVIAFDALSHVDGARYLSGLTTKLR